MYQRCGLGIAILFVSSAALHGDEVELKKFISKEGKFTILLPDGATTTTQSLDTPLGKVKVTTASKENKGVYYAAAYNDLPVDKGNFDVSKSLDGARDGGVKNTGGKLIQEKKITLGREKYPGRELLVSVRDGKLWVRQRIYMVNLRLYQAVIVGSEEEVKSKTADKFLQSFQLQE